MTDRSRENLLRVADVKARTRLSRSTIYRRIADGTFPKPISLSAGLVAWYESDINAWVAAPMDWRAAA